MVVLVSESLSPRVKSEIRWACGCVGGDKSEAVGKMCQQ